MIDIDAIWSSLQSEDGKSLQSNKTKSLNAREGVKKSLTRKMVLDSTKKQQIIAIKQQTQPAFDIDSFTSSVSVAPIQAIDASETKEGETLADNLGELAVEFSALNYDSDDEDDEETLPSSDKQLIRTERLASALKNNDVASQIESLSKLNNIITTLLCHCNDNKLKLQQILGTCGKALFQLVGHHQSEKCRSLSLECIQSLLLANIDLAGDLPYLIPSIVARYIPCGYDKEMEVFVQNQQVHDFFRRGGASNRQDRDGLISQVDFHVIEPNEELRLALCRTINCLVDSIMEKNAAGMLEPYYADLLMSLQTSLKDPFPEVKIAASHCLARLLRIPNFEPGAKYFATGLARAVLPNCRNRNTAVIIAAMDLLEASITVPDRAKAKGAGSAAIADLVGFKADNTIDIAAFYDSQYAVSVNILAELSSHRNPRVRLRCCNMLQSLMIDLPDRYDHEQRLLPYVLLLINDAAAEVQAAALACIDKCGEQYERDHPDEFTQRRQLGVDGDDMIDYNLGLPKPFTCRPSLGARLFVRNNTSRFFLAVLGELTNWRAETRLRSAELLLILAVFCEEHLTKDFHSTLNNVAKAIDIELSSYQEHKHLKILDQIEQVLRLMAKFVDPATYLRLVRPRMIENSFPMQLNFVVMLSSLIKGASFRRLSPHWIELLSLVASPKCIGAFAGSKIKVEGLKALRSLCDRSSGKNAEVLAAHFMNSNNVFLSQALSNCVNALEELLIYSKEEIILTLCKECLDQLQFLNKVLT
jgi:hypothetical protein